ncbi:MAG: ATP-binding protein [Polaromonas sp.]|nr:ATP-binding protein [Polaromonas sp.]
MQKCAMLQLRQRRWIWLLAWGLLSALGSLVLARLALAELRDAFETDARIMHRLLSQRVVQHDAVMATLALLQPRQSAQPQPPEQRLGAVYPQILALQRRDAGAPWPQDSLRAAEARSRQSRHAALANLDLAAGRYQLVLGADPSSYALLIDLRATVPWSEWPMRPDSSPVRVTLEHQGQRFLLQPGQVRDGGWRFDFHKHLAADSQPFDMVAVRQVGWQALPWGWFLAWAGAMAALLLALQALQRQRAGRRRAEELLRLGQISRLNSLGELAAGMAHELNQPLTAVLANTQAASRLLREDPPDLATARTAMTQAVEQARRAASVVGRLRRLVERPELSGQVQPVLLQEALDNALYLLEPELSRRHVQPVRKTPATPLAVLADPVALEQIIHNLLMNALQALEQTGAGPRELTLSLSEDQGQGLLSVYDNGPGIPPERMARIFEPFFTTRQAGLGLGLSLCETLAVGMGGALSASSPASGGAEFRLTLPLAAPDDPKQP